jgi:hypothetical protein
MQDRLSSDLLDGRFAARWRGVVVEAVPGGQETVETA